MFGLSAVSVLVGILIGWFLVPMILGMVASRKSA